jgi:DNA-binding HxlR family transcriptional regulator
VENWSSEQSNAQIKRVEFQAKPYKQEHSLTARGLKVSEDKASLEQSLAHNVKLVFQLNDGLQKH